MTTINPLGTARYGHTQTLLLNGKVLITAGQMYPSSGYLTSAEMYDQGLGF